VQQRIESDMLLAQLRRRYARNVQQVVNEMHDVSAWLVRLAGHLPDAQKKAALRRALATAVAQGQDSRAAGTGRTWPVHPPPITPLGAA
jgi:hypothetical protein